MSAAVCELGPIHLVLNDQIWQEMRSNRERFARWPTSPVELGEQLGEFPIGVPALVQRGKGEHEGQLQILICTPTYLFMAVPSKYDQAYFVPWMSPLTLKVHTRLAQGALLLKAARWHVHTEYGTLPAVCRNARAQIEAAWQALQARLKAVAPPSYRISPVQESYLNTIRTLIEVNRELVLDQAALRAPIGYRAVLSTGEARYTARDVYTFDLVSRPPELQIGDLLRLRDAPELRGRVHACQGLRLTVKFESPVDRAQIGDQGALEFTISDKPYRLQLAAVEALRDGASENRYLLPVLVDGVYQPYRPAPVSPPETLNAQQAEAFCRSLAVPDLLLVLGPPGTGKTSTIVEIIGRHGDQHQRLLVTAKTHPAVDNVLKRLPSERTVVRIGHVDRVSEDTREFLIDVQAEKLQRKILDRTAPHAHELAARLADLDVIERVLDRFRDQIRTLQSARQHLRRVQRALEATDDQIHAHYRSELDRLKATLRRQGEAADALTRQLKTLDARRCTAQSRHERPVLGLYWKWRARRLRRRMERVRTERSQIQQDYAAHARAYRQAQWNYDRAFLAPEYAKLKQQVCEAEDACRRFGQEAGASARRLDQVVAGLVPDRPGFDPADDNTLRRYLAWVRKAIPLLQRRLAILEDWRAALEQRNEELYPVLIRFADVVGATCIGIGTDPRFRDVEFDLVIADEAGQISLPDLLVPLVRAKRAMLVGDHHQLPPYVDNEVQTWLRQIDPNVLPDLAWVDEDATEAEVITALLTRSVFEILFPTAEPAHLVRFTQQYRMPQAVADFAASCFYDVLDTPNEDKAYGARHTDPLFDKPLAFVDTSVCPPDQRLECSPLQNHADTEAWGETGYYNQLEAELIADLAALYQRESLEWVVIVPYRAQAGCVRSELATRLAEAPSLNLYERVSTVDSFQGGECDRVIYGFTRSNPQHKVGFLRELRRLNVAMTRARRQLVLVGDAQTLSQARDLAFRNVAQALLAHVRRRGELISYTQCRARLAERQTL